MRDYIADFIADNWSMRKYDLDAICKGIKSIDVARAPTHERAAPAPDLVSELEQVCKAADAGAGGWVKTSRIRESLAALGGAS